MVESRHGRIVWLSAAALFIFQCSLPAFASITCAVRRHGQYVCTYFCQNGFICDNDNLRCLPGPEAKKNLEGLKEKARVATLIANRGEVKTAQQANSQSTGYDLGSTYYIWDGDPREIPTPQYRPGGGFTPIPRRNQGTGRQPTVRQSLHTRMAAARGGTIALPSVRPIESDSASNSSDSPTSWTPPSKFPKYWEGVDYNDYCANAKGMERGSALYGYLCVPDRSACEPKDDPNYKPFPDPVELSRKVSQICGGPYSLDTRQCFFENKRKIILAANPDLGKACADKLGVQGGLRDQLAKKLGRDGSEGDPNDSPYERCLDDAYLHGPHPPSELREILRRKLAGECGDPAQIGDTEPTKPPPDKLPDDGCGPGMGLRPDISAFGAWTCQPLGGDLLGQDKQATNAQGADPNASSDDANAVDPTTQELEDYLNMTNPNSGGTMRGDLGGPTLPWGSDDYSAIERLQQ